MSREQPDDFASPPLPDETADAEYDVLMDRVDRGEACGLCWQDAQPMQRATALGVALWHCPRCGADSIAPYGRAA